MLPGGQKVSTTTPDEFDALRTIVKTLEAFGADDQNRILRWAAEKLGLGQVQPAIPPARSATLSPGLPTSASEAAALGTTDIKSFVAQKKPKNGTQFAAVVAYYHRFEAPQKKDSITQTDLLDACRMANYQRPPAPGQTLRNAVNAGLLDKVDRGAFSVNSVGENLVAVTLPGDGSEPGPAAPRRRQPRRKRGGQKPARKATKK
jgi:hypothetical protein